MAEAKTHRTSQGGDFKVVPLGFDKNEVMSYILALNKKLKGLEEDYNNKLKVALQENAAANSEAIENELEQRKAELEQMSVEHKKALLDERKNTAQTESRLHAMEDALKTKNTEFNEYKAKVSQKLDELKNQPVQTASISPEQLAEISKKANDDANAVLTDAEEKASAIIEAAKAYFTDTVKKTAEYKDAVVAQIEEATAGVSLDIKPVPAVNVDVSAIVKKAIDEITSALNTTCQTVLENTVAEAEKAAVIPEEVILETSAAVEAAEAAKQTILNIGGFNESELEDFTPITAEPYSFELKVEISTEENTVPAIDFGDILAAETTDDDLFADLKISDGTSFKDEEVIEDISGQLSDMMVSDTTPAPQPAPAAENTSDLSDFAGMSDFADMFVTSGDIDDSELTQEIEPVVNTVQKKAEEPVQPVNQPKPVVAPAPVVEEKPEPVQQPTESFAAPAPDFAVDSDLASLLSDVGADTAAPVAAPAPAKPDDSFNDLLMGVNNDMIISPEPAAPAVQPKSNLNTESSNPWQQFDSDLILTDIEEDEDGMSTGFATPNTAAEPKPVKDEIDLSVYSSLLNNETQFGASGNVDANSVNYDPAWDFAMSTGSDSEDDDEMSSDNVGFFDL